MALSVAERCKSGQVDMARLRWPSLLIAVWANARRAAGLAGSQGNMVRRRNGLPTRRTVKFARLANKRDCDRSAAEAEDGWMRDAKCVGEVCRRHCVETVRSMRIVLAFGRHPGWGWVGGDFICASVDWAEVLEMS
ncbi:hypothetical protein CCUS01_03372 [Colletotrichum cuscutae]|uniref:Uncharacterized protein n=1 Tax=Colletotrichum cuscutae TaxID=1209917 RepID=A0AAI9VGP4_9PEZI|nr:hypothetical protein CCUS01_03372 [Colletotrichum cuscutae]